MKTLLISFILLPLSLLSQTSDSSAIDSSKIYTELSIQTRDLWRGVDFGNHTLSTQMLFTYSLPKNFEIGTYATVSTTKVGYGNTFNFFADWKWKKFRLFLDDYYFEGDKTNMETDFLNYRDCHLLESRVEYESKRVEWIVGYMLYGGKFYTTDANSRAFYLELTAHMVKTKIEDLAFSIGGITGPSALNFHDRAGVTNINLKYTKALNTGKFWGMASFNPNFKYVAPFNAPRVGYGMSKFNFTIGYTL